MKKVDFAIVLHFHQPIGNFDSIFERVSRVCYLPFLQTLSQFPDIPMTFHLSGSLLEYLEERQPRLIELLKEMVARGQIELMSGPYYEPILTAIPERDVVGQVKLMTEYLNQRFASSPQGMWVPEKIWEPHLSKTMTKVGGRYCVLDEMHFLQARIDKQDTFGYFVTGKGQRQLAVFSSDKKLRYAIPFKLPSETLNYFRDIAVKQETPLFVYSDDVEKFGEWPETHAWVYEKGWLKDFFETLQRNRDWITLYKLSDYLDSHKPLGEAELPEGSYVEMREWAGGPWKNFLSKYPEANQMHKKMCYVSDKVDHARKMAKAKDRPRITEAERALYKGQCNCAYWHGLFGGLYFYHLRDAVYHHLIEAERIADEVLHKNKRQWLEIKSRDLGGNGKKILIMETPTLSAYIDPYSGGVIQELDNRPYGANLINTLSRRQEPYIRECCPFDKYPRHCLRDHFLRAHMKREDFVNACHEECGDFHTGRYTAQVKNKKLLLRRAAGACDSKFKVAKTIRVKPKNTLEITYRIEAAKPYPEDIIFGVEFNLTMPYLDASRYRYMYNNKTGDDMNADGSIERVRSFGIGDTGRGLGLRFAFSKKAQDVWYFPVKTLSQSEGVYRRTYQGSCILPRWKLDFKKSKKWDLTVRWAMV
jgi:alpha-amylase